jgi:hypothetical protein
MSTRQDTATLPGAAAAPVLKTASINEAPRLAETAKPADTPKPVEAALKAVADMQPAKAGKPQAASSDAIAAASIKPTGTSRPLRFALLAASIAFAGAFGAMAGALGMSLISTPATTAPQLEAIDLTIVQGAMASLRNELSAIKSSVENSNRDVNAQLAKFTEQLEKRTSAQPSAQAPARSPADVTASVRPQALATPSAPRPRVIEGWALRRVSRGTAIIQGHEGAIEVVAGDIVPGIGRIESIRRLDGRWVVLTHGGMITAQPPR